MKFDSLRRYQTLVRDFESRVAQSQSPDWQAYNEFAEAIGREFCRLPPDFHKLISPDFTIPGGCKWKIQNATTAERNSRKMKEGTSLLNKNQAMSQSIASCASFAQLKSSVQYPDFLHKGVDTTMAWFDLWSKRLAIIAGSFAIIWFIIPAILRIYNINLPAYLR